MVQLTAPRSFEIIKYILDKVRFTQYQAHNDLKCSFFLINQLTNWLVEKGYVEREERKYVLKKPLDLIIDLAVFRNLNSLKLTSFSTSLDSKETVTKLSSDGIFCLDTALATYSNYWRSNRVCLYVKDKDIKKIKEKFIYRQGNKTEIVVFQEKPEIKATEKGRITIKGKSRNIYLTDKIRTVIDLVCDNKLFTAKHIVKELWGINLET